MENITKSHSKRRKLSATLSAKLGTFNENGTALPKSTCGKKDIRNYFTSTSKHPYSLQGRITNGHSDEHVLDSTISENSIILKDTDTVAISHLQEAPVTVNDKICNGNHCSSDEVKFLSSKHAKENSSVEEKCNDDDVCPISISNKKSTPLKPKPSICSNKSYTTYDCRSLSNSPLKVNGCELIPCITRLSGLDTSMSNIVASTEISNSVPPEKNELPLTCTAIPNKRTQREKDGVLSFQSSPLKGQKEDKDDGDDSDDSENKEDEWDVENIIGYSWCREQVISSYT